MVAHTGLEPVVSALRGQRVSRLHQCAGWPRIIVKSRLIAKLDCCTLRSTKVREQHESRIALFPVIRGLWFLSPSQLAITDSQSYTDHSNILSEKSNPPRSMPNHLVDVVTKVATLLAVSLPYKSRSLASGSRYHLVVASGSARQDRRVE